MNKSQLIEAIAADSGLTKADSARAIDSLLGTVTKTLKKGDEVSITGFGKFSVVKRAARQGVNPRTGERVKIKASKAPKFSAGATLKQAVQPEEIDPAVRHAMALVSELELPAFDYTDPSMRGERFHEAMGELREQGWLAQGPFGYIVLDREAGEFFLRTRSAIFPGMKIAEIFGVSEGPLYEQMRRNILHVNGPDHSRLRSLVNPALSPRAVERYRPAMRGFLEELLARRRRSAPRSTARAPPRDGHAASSWRRSPSRTRRW